MFVLVHERVLGCLAVAIAIATLFCRLGVLPLLAPDEGRNAEVAREMKESGAWLVPTYNGAAYLDKPAFFFKTVALSLALFGNSEAVARIPSAAAAAVLVLIVFAFCRKIHGTRCALLAAIVVASTPLYLANARIVILDMMLTLFVCGAIFAGYLAELSESSARRYWYLAGAASAGVATLIKGPIGLLIPALVLLVFNGLEGRAGAWKRLLSPGNILVVLGIVLPWFIGLCFQHPDFFQYGLLEESFKRFTVAKRFHRSEPFYFYLPIVGATFLPWSVLFPEAIVATWKQRGLKHSADRLCLVWAIVVFVFFSLSQSKLPGYILSVTVACGILVARIIDAALAAPEGGAGRLVRRATGAFSAGCLVTTLVMLGGGSSFLQWLARPLRIPVEEAKGLFQTVVPLLVVAVVFGGLGLIAFLRRNIPLCFLCLALFPPVFCHSSLALFSVIFEAKSARHLARHFSKLPATTNLACLECFPSGLPFYLGRTLPLVSKGGGELTSNYIIYSIEKTGQWPANLSPITCLDHWLELQKRPLYLIAPSSRREKLTAIATAAGAKIEPLPAGFWGVQLPSKGEH